MSSKARLQPRQLEANLVVGPTALKPDPGRLELEKPEAMKGNSSPQQEKQLSVVVQYSVSLLETRPSRKSLRALAV